MQSVTFMLLPRNPGTPAPAPWRGPARAGAAPPGAAPGPATQGAGTGGRGPAGAAAGGRGRTLSAPAPLAAGSG